MSAHLHVLQYIHPFYVASDLPDLDAAFEDGKRRAISTLENRIAQVRASTRADYERAFLSQPTTPPPGHVQEVPDA